MSDQSMRNALSAISLEVETLLQRDDLPEEVEERLEVIAAISRYRIDIRDDEEFDD